MTAIRRFRLSALLCTALAVTAGAGSAPADESADVAAIEAGLDALEQAHPELAPAGLNVYVTLRPGDEARLDSVRLQLDGTPLVHYLYTEREVAALRNEGVHRLYRGGMAPGLHELTVEVTALGPGGRPVTRRQTVRVGARPRHTRVGVVISTRGGEPDLEVREW